LITSSLADRFRFVAATILVLRTEAVENSTVLIADLKIQCSHSHLRLLFLSMLPNVKQTLEAKSSAVNVVQFIVGASPM